MPAYLLETDNSIYSSTQVASSSGRGEEDSAIWNRPQISKAVDSRSRGWAGTEVLDW